MARERKTGHHLRVDLAQRAVSRYLGHVANRNRAARIGLRRATLQQLILLRLHVLDVFDSDLEGTLDTIGSQLAQRSFETAIPSNFRADLTGKHARRSTVRSQHQLDIRNVAASSALDRLGEHSAAVVVGSWAKYYKGIEEMIVAALSR